MRKIFGALIVALVVSFVGAIPAQAAISFLVLPSKLELPGKPGEVLTKKVTLYNKGVDKLTVATELKDYSISEDNQFEYFDPGTLDFSIAKWIKVDPAEFTVEGGKQKEVSITMTVPKKAVAHGYQSILFFEASSGAEPSSAGVGIKGRIGVVLLGSVGDVAVGGETGGLVRKGDVSDLQVRATFPPFISFKDGGLKVDFNGLFKPEVRAITVFRNDGNMHLNLQGQTVFKGSLWPSSQIVDLPEITILSGTDRDLEAVWTGAPFFGNVNVETKVAFVQGEWKTKVVDLMIIPWNLIWVLAVLLVIVLVIVILIMRRRRKTKKIMAMMEQILAHEKHEAKDKKNTKEEKKEHQDLISELEAVVEVEEAEELAEKQEEQAEEEKPAKGKKKSKKELADEQKDVQEEGPKKGMGALKVVMIVILFVLVAGLAVVAGYYTAQILEKKEGGIVAQTTVTTLPVTETVTAAQTEETTTETEAAETIEPTETATQEAVSGETYTVKSGDTLYGIANRLDILWKDLAELNGIKEPYTLSVGQELKLPAGTVVETEVPTETPAV